MPNKAMLIRTPWLQVDNDNAGAPEHSWLAPRPPPKTATQTVPNVVYVKLPRAIALSKLRIWNYAKTPTRGAREVEIILDDALIYKGHVAKASAETRDYHCILFTNAPSDIKNEQRRVKCSLVKLEKNHLTLINEGSVKNRGIGFAPPPKPTSSARPGTAVVM